MAVNGTPTERPKLYARDVIQLGDDALRDLLREYGYVVPIEDPENLTADFYARLKNRRDESYSRTCYITARVVDLDYVSARLQKAPCYRERPPAWSLQCKHTAPPLSTAEEFFLEIEHQQNCYDTLVKLGGRPSHPRNLFDDIVDRPEYHDILSFWKDGEKERGVEWTAFDLELERWLAFRGFQRFSRGQRGSNYWRGRFEDKKLLASLDPTGEASFEWSFEEFYDQYKELDDVIWVDDRVYWISLLNQRDVPTEQIGFTEYARLLKEELEKHGLNEEFRLSEDLDQQDAKATWMEYLGFEYWWYDRKLYHSRPEKYNKAWKTLEESGGLRGLYLKQPNAQSLRNLLHARRFFEEENVARYNERGESARELLELSKRRASCLKEFLRRTGRLWKPREEAEKHQLLLLPWIRNQLYLVKAEMNEKGRAPGPNQSKHCNESAAVSNCTSPPSEERNGSNVSIDMPHSPAEHHMNNGKLPLKRNREELNNENPEYDERYCNGDNDGIQARSKRPRRAAASKDAVTQSNSQRGKNGKAPTKRNFAKQRGKNSNSEDHEKTGKSKAAAIATNALSPPADPKLSSKVTKAAKRSVPAKRKSKNVEAPLRRSPRIAEKAKRLNSTALEATISTKVSKRTTKRANTETATQRRAPKRKGRK